MRNWLIITVNASKYIFFLESDEKSSSLFYGQLNFNGGYKVIQLS